MGLFAKKIEKQIASYQQELIETHYREVDNMYRQIRGWRHDYRNHIQTMKAYAAAGDWDAIRNYLDLLDTDLQTVDTVIKTGNPMTDAILNSKISLAKAKGIEVAADAHIPVRLKSSEIRESGDNAWRAYNLKNVSTAMWKAERKEHLPLTARHEIFATALEGKEITFDEGADESLMRYPNRKGRYRADGRNHGASERSDLQSRYDPFPTAQPKGTSHRAATP